MSSVRGSGVTRLHNPVIEEIVPGHDWTEDSNGHYLLIDLPGFKKEQVKIQIFGTGIIKVRGERPVVNENKHVQFEQDFKVPENSDSDAITAKFDAEILYIIVPKHKVEEKTEPEPAGIKDQSVANTSEEKKKEEKPDDKEAKKDEDDNIHANAGNGMVCEGAKKEGRHRNGPMRFTEDIVRRWEGEPSYARSAMKILSKNKGIVVTAILAFSLGMLISRKFETPDGQ